MPEPLFWIEVAYSFSDAGHGEPNVCIGSTIDYGGVPHRATLGVPIESRVAQRMGEVTVRRRWPVLELHPEADDA